MGFCPARRGRGGVQVAGATGPPGTGGSGGPAGAIMYYALLQWGRPERAEVDGVPLRAAAAVAALRRCGRYTVRR